MDGRVRLWILSDLGPAAGGDDLWLELAFPDGNSYLSAPINVPLYPDLLKTVTARLHHRPDRANPHQAACFEH